ncbi:hypothetical protein [Jiella sp. M17.18]|uniref:hypothetical protein n=1 Tax=Jiella sp. M17.18 TaxID=3234247 RepID=UPI0034DDE836
MAAAGYGLRVLATNDAALPAGTLLAEDAAAHLLPPDAPRVEAGEAHDISLPKIALLRGRGSAYPYCGYYAHALAALGYVFDVVNGPDIASGALDGVDLFVLPGGFSTWGIDRCENVAGADAAVRRFLSAGGSAIGSCGGAFYLSSGRPGWLALAEASPRYSHEYLKSGAGIVSIAMQDDGLGAGVAPLVEMPYYHGPIYEAVRAPVTVHGRFRSLSMPARIPIDNPLSESRFDQEMAGRTAILSTAGPNGRAVLFSAHPEMGDLVRKYVSFASYIERYLPIRGSTVMEETLDFYVPNAAPSFRLIFNAVQWCASAGGSRRSTGGQALDRQPTDVSERVKTAVLDALPAIDCGSGPLQALFERERMRLTNIMRCFEAGELNPDRGMTIMLEDAAASLATPAPLSGTAQRLLDAELALRLLEVTRHRDALAAAFHEDGRTE